MREVDQRGAALLEREPVVALPDAEEAREQPLVPDDRGEIDDPGQSSRGHAELLTASPREGTRVIADPVGSSGNSRGMADDQQLHGRPARARGSLRRGSRAPGLTTPSLEPWPTFEEGRSRLLSPLALPSHEGLGQRVAGLGAVQGLMEIALEYHGVRMFSKNVLDLPCLVEEALGAAAARRAHELRGVPGALDPDADGMQVLGARTPGQRLDRPAELAELRRGDAQQRDVRAADAGAPEGRLPFAWNTRRETGWRRRA